MRRTARRPLTLLPAAIIACATPSATPALPSLPPTLVMQGVPEPAAQTGQPTFCALLRGLVAAEGDGFAALRGMPLDAERWTGERTVPGTDRCTIEGAAWPRARYVCTGGSLPEGQRERVAAQFALLSSRIERCLESSVWDPGRWQKGESFAFAMGERQQTWTDRSRPPSAVILRLQRDVLSHDYRVRLDFAAIR